MPRLRQAPEVIAIAKNLGLSGNDPVEAVTRYCRERVESWLSAFAGAANLQQLHQVVADRLSIHHVVVRTDQELDEVIAEYASRGELIFRTLPDEFVGGTQAITFKLRNPRRGMRRHVAVIDGRGDRAARVYFGKRHEDSHLLSLSPMQLAFVFRRTHVRLANAEEALMDRIGGELAFYPPLFQPDLRRLQSRYGRPCFQFVDDLQEAACPEASYIATAIAAVEQNDVAAVLLSAHYGAKRGDDSVPPRTWALRIGRVRASASAKNLGMVIPWNYRVPRSSVIYEVLHGLAPSHAHADERLGSWTSSDGRALRDLPVHIEARRYGDEVLAVLTLE